MPVSRGSLVCARSLLCVRAPVYSRLCACARSCRSARSCGRSTPSRCPSSWCAPSPPTRTVDSDRRLGLPTRIADSDRRLGSRLGSPTQIADSDRECRLGGVSLGPRQPSMLLLQKREAPPSLRSLSQRSRRVLQQYKPGCVCVCVCVCARARARAGLVRVLWGACRRTRRRALAGRGVTAASAPLSAGGRPSPLGPAALTAPSRHHHGTITAPSRHHHGTITAPSRHHHGTITAPPAGARDLAAL